MGRRVDFCSDFAPKKCIRKEDRISELPGEILISILSRLTLKDAGCTSVLSTRWINLWTFTTRLDFYDPEALGRIAFPKNKNKQYLEEETRKYVNWVDQVLTQHRGYKLDQFSINFNLCRSYQENIDKWLKLAFAKNVQKLKLHLFGPTETSRNSFHAYFFHDTFCFSGLPVGFLKTLRELSLKCVNVTGEVLEFFLHNCPFLEQLIVRRSETLLSLEVSGPYLALKRLEVSYCMDMETLIVRDTNLVSLKVVNAGALQLENVHSLVDLHIGYYGIRCIDLGDLFFRLSCCLAQLVCLTLCTDGEHLKSFEHHKFPELINLKQLALIVEIDDGDSLLGSTSLIQAAPSLKRLFLVVRDFFTMVNTVIALEENAVDSWALDFSQASQHKLKNKRIRRLIAQLKRVVPSHVELLIL